MSVQVVYTEIDKRTVLGPPRALAAFDDAVKHHVKRPPGRKVDAGGWRDETHASKDHWPGDVVEKPPFAAEQPGDNHDKRADEEKPEQVAVDLAGRIAAAGAKGACYLLVASVKHREK